MTHLCMPQIVITKLQGEKDSWNKYKIRRWVFFFFREKEGDDLVLACGFEIGRFLSILDFLGIDLLLLQKQPVS